jgi:hypothetical protein
MADLIVIMNDIPDAEELRNILVVFGHGAELRGYDRETLLGNPRAILLPLHSNQELTADRRAADLRMEGFAGILAVLGRSAPDIDLRQRLAEQKAWFLPAISGPGEIACRVRQLL